MDIRTVVTSEEATAVLWELASQVNSLRENSLCFAFTHFFFFILQREHLIKRKIHP